MDAFQGAARLIGMDDAVWAKHAHPLSVWSRMLAAPVIFLCLWSPVWIGWYGAGLIAMALVWMWINPRLCPPPKTGRSWASKGVIGERIFINRKAVPVPEGYKRAAFLTSGLSALFMLGFVYAYYRLDVLAAALAWHGSAVAKYWFVDRMAMLTDTMADAHPAYTAWLAGDWSATPEDEAASGESP
jgi:hypothetical protein